MTPTTISVAIPYELWLALQTRAQEENQSVEEYAARLLEAATSLPPENE